MSIEYLAGLFDGEGTFSIQVDIRKTKLGTDYVQFNPRMTMSLKYGREVLEELVSEFGGSIYYYETEEDRWYLGSREGMLLAAKNMLPYLRIKKHIAERFIEALEMFPPIEQRYVKKGEGKKMWTKELTDKVAYIALTLNPPSARKSTKTLEYLKELEAIYACQQNFS